MKKTLTLLFAIGTITIASAQSSKRYDQNNQRDDRGAVYDRSRGNEHYDHAKTYNRNNYYFSARERDEQIKRINREYAERISDVKRNRRLRNSERNAQVRMLERQRDERVRDVQSKFYAPDNQHRDNGYAKSSNRNRW